MKTFYSALLLILLGFLNVNAMQQLQQPSGPIAEEQKPNLIIHNNYVDQVGMQYIYQGSPTVIRNVIQPGETLTLEDVRSLDDLKFESYGKWKGYLNFTNSPNWRTKMNDTIWQSPITDDIHLYIKATQFPEEKKGRVGELSLYPEEEPKGWGAYFWQLGSGAWEKAKEVATLTMRRVGQLMIAYVGPFEISWEPKPKTKGAVVAEIEIIAHPYEAFKKAIEAKKAGKKIIGRYILGVGDPYEDTDVIAAKDRLIKEWMSLREQYKQEKNAIKWAMSRRILALIEEAAKNPDAVMPDWLLY